MKRLILKGGNSLQELINDADRIRLWLEREGDNVAAATMFALLGQVGAWRRQFDEAKADSEVKPETFRQWWDRIGFSLDPECGVPWYDKREQFAEMAFAAGVESVTRSNNGPASI